MAMLERTRLLIIDDWGPEPLTAEQRRDLLEIVDDRHEKGSLLIHQPNPIGRWHEVIGDHTLGDGRDPGPRHSPRTPARTQGPQHAQAAQCRGQRHNQHRLDERQGEVRRNQPSVVSPRCSGMSLVSGPSADGERVFIP